MTYNPGGILTVPYWTALVAGTPGSGKTQILGSIPGVFLLDIDNRAAATRCPRDTFPMTPEGASQLEAAIEELIPLKPDADGFLTHPRYGTRFTTIAIDSLSEYQRQVGNGIPMPMTKGGYPDKLAWYGLLKERVMSRLIMRIKRLNCNVAISCHVNREKMQEGAKAWEMLLQLEGAVREIVPGYMDLIAYIEQGQGGTRFAVTERMIYQGDWYYGKDSYNLFQDNFTFTITNDGVPNFLAPLIGIQRGGLRAEWAQEQVSEAVKAVAKAGKAAAMLPEELEPIITELRKALPEEIETARENGLETIANFKAYKQALAVAQDEVQAACEAAEVEATDTVNYVAELLTAADATELETVKTRVLAEIAEYVPPKVLAKRTKELNGHVARLAFEAGILEGERLESGVRLTTAGNERYASLLAEMAELINPRRMAESKTSIEAHIKSLVAETETATEE